MNVTSSSGWVGEPDYRRGVKWRKLLLEIEVRCRCTSVLASTASTTASGVLGMSERWNVGLLSVPTFRYYWVEHEDRDAATPCTLLISMLMLTRDLFQRWVLLEHPLWRCKKILNIHISFEHALRWANFRIMKHCKKKANPHPHPYNHSMNWHREEFVVIYWWHQSGVVTKLLGKHQTIMCIVLSSSSVLFFQPSIRSVEETWPYGRPHPLYF